MVLDLGSARLKERDPAYIWKENSLIVGSAVYRLRK